MGRLPQFAFQRQKSRFEGDAFCRPIFLSSIASQASDAELELRPSNADRLVVASIGTIGDSRSPQLKCASLATTQVQAVV